MGISGGGGAGAGAGSVSDTIYDAKGDLAVGTGADTAARVPVGSNNQVLVADSTQTTGVAWEDLVQVSGGSGVAPVRLATNAVLSGTPAYLNGTAGVGATLVSTAFGALSVDSVAVAVGDRILVKNQASTLQNGIYVVSATGGGAAFYTLTRATDYDQTVDVFEGTFTLVSEGTVNAQSAWQMTTSGAITMGTTAIVFAELAGEVVSTATPVAVGAATPGTSPIKSNQDHGHDTLTALGLRAELNGMLGWTMDPTGAGTDNQPTAATIYLVKMMVPTSISITNILVNVSSAGTSYTNGQLGVYSGGSPNGAAGVYLGASAVLASAGTNSFGSLGAVTVPMGSAIPVIGGSGVFVWLAVHLGTNNVTVVKFRGSPANAATANIGTTAATARFGAYTGHATNTLATIGNLTPASISLATNFPIFMGVT